MATSASLNYGSTDPRSIAAQQRATIGNQGAVLNDQYAQYGQQNAGGAPVNTVASTSNYLNPLEQQNAEGGGGYTSNEASQIELSPQDKQNIINGAGISAGTASAASTGAAQRAFNATGGNPAAMAAYRSRAAQQEGVNSGNAMTQARIGAQQAGSAGAQAVGNAQIAQENQGLNYFAGQNAQANQNVQQGNALQEQTYGTQTSGGNQAAGLGVQASQTPSTLDKIAGFASGALGALAEGDVEGDEGGQAVIAEDGPEKVVQAAEQGLPADPIRQYMDDGGFAAPSDGEDMTDDQQPGAPTAPMAPSAPGTVQQQPWWQKFSQSMKSSGGGAQQQQWNPTSTYKSIGNAAGGLGKLALGLADGGFPTGGKGGNTFGAKLVDNPISKSFMPKGDHNGQNGIFTKPTLVNLKKGEAVVPLGGYRSGAKARPSMANLPAAPQRRYGAGG